MTIASEISRLQQAKADLKTSIEGKGVTVTSGTKLDGYADLVDDIQTGGGANLQSKSVTISGAGTQTLTPDTGYDGFDGVTITTPETNLRSQSMIFSVDSKAKLTAQVTPSAGWLTGGVYENNYQMTKQDGQTITPGTTDQTIPSGRYITGTQTIKGDANLVAGNIKSGVSIFGVAGSYSGGSPSLQSKTVSISGSGTQTVTPDSGYDGLDSVEITTPAGSQGTPDISMTPIQNPLRLRITASATDTSGYITGTTKTATEDISARPAQTITPGTTDQTISSGVYLTGNQTIKGDANLTAGNIKKDVSIFGVTGTYEGSGSANLQSKSVTITQNGTQTVSPDTGYDGLSSVAITTNVSSPVPTAGFVPSAWDGVGFITSGDHYGNVRSYYYANGYIVQTTNTFVTDNILNHLETITFHNTTSIGDYAFRGCSNLALTSLPAAITSIGSYAFYGCSNITLTSLPSNISVIETNAFYGCSKLNLSSLPSLITKIESDAFHGCTRLSLTELPSGLTGSNIYSYAFYGCSNLALTSLPSGITEITAYCFYGCSGLLLSSLPSGVTTIGAQAFYDCSNITLSSLPSGLSSSGLSASSIFMNCSKITISGIPSSVTTLGGSCFQNCTLIPKIIANGVTAFGSGSVFRNCTSLQKASFPVLSVSTSSTLLQYTFYGDTALEYCDLGIAGRVYTQCFYNCSSLNELVLRKTGSICAMYNINAFSGTPMASGTGTIYVPSALISNYQTATNWKTLYQAGTQFVALEGSQYETPITS